MARPVEAKPGRIGRQSALMPPATPLATGSSDTVL